MGSAAIDLQVGVPSLAEALDRLRVEDFEGGRALLAERVRADHDDADSWAYLSGALLATGDPIEAESAIARALAANPHGFAPHLKAAELDLRFGNASSAERHGLVALRAASTESERGAARAMLVLARTRLRHGVARTASLPRLSLSRLRTRLSR
jgi:tetratricopeptide (TPR) repeat protein